MRLYRALLRAYPSSFRREYGGEMLRLFAERRRHASAPARAALWAEAVADAAVTAPRIHLDILRQDLRHTRRTLGASRAFAAAAVLVMAIGIGATTAAFSITDRVLLRPLPFAEPDRLVQLWERSPGYSMMEPSPANFVDWRARARAFEAMAATALVPMNVMHRQPERITGIAMTVNLFTMLGVQPAIGRNFLPAEAEAEAPAVAIISDSLWRRVFGGDPSALGATVRINEAMVTIVGVMPADFYYPHREMEAWIPLRIGPAELSERDNNYLNVVARLASGTSLEHARSEMAAITAALAREYPVENADTGATVLPLADQVPSQSRALIRALAAAAGCLLLIACTNLASLLLTRFSTRRHELTVRAALGAGPERLLRQLLTESLALAGAGGVLGILLAWITTPLLSRLVPTTLPVPEATVLDGRVLLFAAAVTVLTGVVFGVLPGLRASRAAGAEALRTARTAGRGGDRLRRALVVAQITAAVMLLVSAGLLIRALARVQAVHPGFESAHVLVARTPLQGDRYVPTAARARFYERVLDEVRALPGVRQAAFTSFAPFTARGGIWVVEMPGRQDPERHGDRASLRFITPGYFETLRIPLLRGRDVSAADTIDGLMTAIVSESFVRRYWPGEEPIGRTFTFAFRERTIVGVVGDVRVRGLERESEPQVYLPYQQVPDGGLIFYAPKDLLVRSDGDAAAVTGAIRRIVQRIDPELPVTDARPLGALVAGDVAPRRTQVTVLVLFAAMSLLLAGVGLHGLLAFGVARRRREIGVRMALGATRARVVRMVAAEGARLAAVGAAAGVALGYAAGRQLEAMLGGVRAADGVTFAAALALVLAAAVSGTLLPALRAVRVDPQSALRTD